MKKRILSMALVLAMAVGLVACGGSTTPESEGESKASSTDANGGADPAEDEVSAYDKTSAEIYDSVLGEFYSAYEVAREASNVSERYALMAIAEAKLLESAVMIPTQAQGGNYAISRLAPYSVNYALWGTDNDRYHQALVTTEFITAEHRLEIKEKWNELKGTGTFADWEKQYLIDKGYTLKDTYNAIYYYDPMTWDVLSSSNQNDSDVAVNTYDGLLEYDCEGELQPALAESYTVSDDGLTYTFKIREGVKWVDSQGREVADVVADDFVAGLQHVMDAKGGLEYLLQTAGIAGVDDYMNNGASFDVVGVEAVDEHTLVYTLDQPCSFFLTMLGYGVFAPMSRTYYVSQGGKFGNEFSKEAADYTYGKSSDNIAYCGPYLVTNATTQNTIVFQANPSYWNKDNINIHTITWLYNDGSDATKAYNDAVAGTIDGCGMNAASVVLAKDEGNFDKYCYIAATNATTYSAFYNLNRAAFANTNDGAVVSKQTEEEAKRTNQAIGNVHFRRAISFAVDRAAYLAQSVGEDLKLTSLRNSYTPGNFVALLEDVTVDINGEAVTFAEGTEYGVILQAQLDADGVAIKAYDADADDGLGSSDGYDGWYSVDNAVAELNIAIDELAAQGLTIDAEHPIHLDLPYPSQDETYTNRAQTWKQCVENSLGGKVIVDLTLCANDDEWSYAGYYTYYGYEQNYDIYDLSGWGPDYGDPSTFLDTFLPGYAGYMVRCLGIY